MKPENVFRRFRVVAVLACLAFFSVGVGASRAQEAGRPRMAAPELTGGTDWLNTPKPILLKNLKGKVVLLDFWTLCCINCIHTLPDLAKLEAKYPKELVVIGVHSPKFDNEKSTESIRKALARYEVRHPVVNDAGRKIWESFQVDSWPTLVLIDHEGKLVARGSGEGLYDAVDAAVAELVKSARAKKELDEKPFDYKPEGDVSTSPLRFPGKVITDPEARTMFVADSTNHRVVCAGIDGKVSWSVGTGKPGDVDGPGDKAQFNDPQGMALVGTKLYVADRKNHKIKSVDTASRIVSTVAGTGIQGQDRRTGGAGLKTGLNSPWDLWVMGDRMFVAMAGFHQIWLMDIKEGMIQPFAGNGRETLTDGPLAQSCFAQPSGLSSDGKSLFVADSETSSVRSIGLDAKGAVTTLAGSGLFNFGDQDGVEGKVLLQHALGVAWSGKQLFVADTYNSKIKVIDPATRSCSTFMTGFKEPAGIWYAAGKLYVANTNAHEIVEITIDSKAKRVVEFKGLSSR